MRKVLLAVAAIVLFGGGAILFILLATGGPDGSSSANPDTSAAQGSPGPAGPLPPIPARPAPDLTGLGVTGAGVQGPRIETLPPPPKPPPGSWEAVDLSRPRALGPLGGALGAALADLEPDLSACFGKESQSRHALEHYTMTKDHSPLGDVGATILVLQVETQDGRATIVDAPVETLGDASDGLVACAQRVLRGRSFPAPGTKAGAKYRVVHNLLQ
jgi:hypothetical protein